MVGVWPTVDEIWLEHAFHHEFAHALSHGKGVVFPTVAWRRANTPGFVYASEVEGAGGYAALPKGKSGRGFDPKLNEPGLLSEYGTATFDEDWACIAEEVVADNPAFWDLLPKYPRLREKGRLVVEFYRRAMPGIRLRSVGETGS